MARTQVVAKVVILDNNSNFLLLTRSDTHPMLAGFYDLPGGQVEDDEEPGEAVIREVKEETGLSIDQLDLRVMYSVTMLIRERSWPTLLYMTRLEDREPSVTLSYEHKSYEWASLDRLAEVEPHLAPTYRQALEYIRANNIIADSRP